MVVNVRQVVRDLAGHVLAEWTSGRPSTLGIALGPLTGGRLYDAFGSYARLFIGSF